MLSNSTIEVEISHADTVWILVAGALILLMVPGVGFYYGGIIQRKNYLSILSTSGLALAIVSFQWFFWGYSISFSEHGSDFIGDLHNFALKEVSSAAHPAAPSIPEMTYVFIQGMFACITPVLAFGSAAERTRLPSYLLFLFVWSTLVYDFCCYWCWAKNGWLHHMGVLDYAGGTPVHVCSGFAALAYALMVGPRKHVDHKKLKPSSVGDVFLGTMLLWFGWFGFNGGSETAINSRAVNAVFISNLSAAMGGLTWMILEMVTRRSRKMSLNGFCCGVIAGLVCITPAAGFTSAHYALVFGFAGAFFCFYATEAKHYFLKFRYDDACDVMAVHGVGGIVGCLLTGIFAQNSIATMSGGDEIKGGWVDGHFMQILYQLVSVIVVGLWSFVMTCVILKLIDYIPFFHLKLNAWEQKAGTDLVELGEAAYGHDTPDYEMLKLERTDFIQKCTCGYYRKNEVKKDAAEKVQVLVLKEEREESN